MLSNELYNTYIQPFEQFLVDRLDNLNAPAPLKKAILYTMVNGGKRLRPLLAMSAGKLYGLYIEQLLPLALSIECVHTYSLIHDDLPCMDNSPLRRGKPSCWASHGEAIAILAGDALLSLSFSLLTSEKNYPSQVIAALADLSGAQFLIAGQTLDITQDHNKNQQYVEKLAIFKTGALFKFCLTAPALIANKAEDEIDRMTALAAQIALIFQYHDDWQDVHGNSQDMGKPTQLDKDKYTLYDAWNGNPEAHYKNLILQLDSLDKNYQELSLDLLEVIQIICPELKNYNFGANGINQIKKVSYADSIWHLLEFFR